MFPNEQAAARHAMNCPAKNLRDAVSNHGCTCGLPYRDEIKRLKAVIATLRLEITADCENNLATLTAERDQLAALVEQLRYALENNAPHPLHDGPCGPNAGCDSICMEAALVGNLLRRSPADALKVHDAEVRKAVLEEAYPRVCEYCKLFGTRVVEVNDVITNNGRPYWHLDANRTYHLCDAAELRRMAEEGGNA